MNTPNNTKIWPLLSTVLIIIGLLILGVLAVLGGLFMLEQQRQITALRSVYHTLSQQVDQSTLENQQKITLLETKLDVSALSARALAEHAIRSANLQLQSTGNTDMAHRLLELARAQLVNYHSEAVESLKEKINADIALLNTMPALRLEERLTALDTLIGQVNDLPILPSTRAPTAPVTTNWSRTDWKQHWRQYLTDGLGQFRSLIVIHKTDAEQDFFLTPEQFLLAKQLCMAELMQSEWAVLHGDPQRLTQTLRNAKKMLEGLPVSRNTVIPLSTTIDALLQDPLPRVGDIHLQAVAVLDTSQG